MKYDKHELRNSQSHDQYSEVQVRDHEVVIH
jgi:hypothetical protein